MDDIVAMYGRHHDELQLPMNFNLFWSSFTAPAYRRELNAWETQQQGWPLLFFSNHDFPRSYSRLGDGVNDAAIARVLAALLLTARGTPIVYYGEELGMTNADLSVIQARREQSGSMRQPPFDARDAMRTPMQWDGTPNAGFSTATPWLPLEAHYETVTVVSEEGQPASLLNLYRRLIALRRSQPPLRAGIFIPLSVEDPSTSSALLAYMRRSHGRSIAIILNLSAREQTTRLFLDGRALSLNPGRILLAEAATIQNDGAYLKLGPFGILIITADAPHHRFRSTRTARPS
jgi:alpha-glucosidase